MKKKAVSLIAALCMVFAMLPVMGLAADTSGGSCGENVSWTLDADGVLTISGAGKMDDYEYYGSPSEGKTAPWYEQKDSIKKVIIEDGVTSIGSNAFLNCGSVTSVEAAQSVESIGGNAFWNCSALVSVEIPKNVKSIGGYAFYNCSALKLVDTDDMDAWCRISFENALSNPLYYANALFAGGRVVSSVEIPSDMTAIGPYTFYGMSGLKTVTIPLGVTDIGESAFSGTSLETVYYYGSRTDWKKINIAADNDRLTSAGIGYNTNSNITWSLDGNGVLTISGTGKMQNYSLFHYVFYNDAVGDEVPEDFKNLPPPWYEQRGSIKKIVIEKGVTSIGSNAFADCTSLTSVVIPSSVRSIGGEAFWGCSALKSIVIPKGVKTIGASAFAYCESLESADIGPSVETISSSFENCTALKSVRLRGAPKDITSWAFSECPNLKTVEISNLAVWCATDFGSWSTPIYNRGFYVNGEKVTALVVPEGAERIGNYAFSGSGITSVYIPASVTEIGIRPFFGCSLNSIEISADNPAFVMYDGCIYTKDMKTLVMCPTTRSGSFEVPSGVETIADSAFYECKGLTSVYIPFGVKSIGNAAFSGCEGLTYIYVPAGVKTIGGSAFSRCKNLTSVEIGEGVESIGDNAFYDCKKLATAWIPSSVTSIGGDVLFSALYISYDARPELFYGGSRESWEALTKDVRSISFKDPKIHYNSKLPVRGIGGKCGGDVKWTLNESGVFTLSGTGKMDDYELYHQTANLVTVDYDMPEGFTPVEPPWYSQREYIKKVIIEDGITYIGSNAFADCENLESVSMAAGVEKIGNEAFYNCKSLKTAELPRGLTVIGNHAFCECPGLEAAQIPEGVTEIGESAFSDCEGLKSLTIPSSTAKIGRFAFGWCRGLTSVTVPSGVKRIESSAFYECSGLTSLEIQPGVETIGYSAFFGCAKLTKVEIPETVTSIDMDAFAECHGLLSVTIPSGVTAVKSGTFYNCKSLSTVTIPVSVTSIGESAFTYCGALSDIYYGGSKSQWQSLKKSGQGEKFYSANMHYGAVDVEDISIDPASVIMEAGNKKTLSATVAPEDATDKTVTWSTSDEGVAAVDENGTVTAIAEGTAVITAASGNVSAKCSVTVTPAVLTAVDFTVNAVRGSVKLSWNEVSGATDYRVYRKTADGDWEILASEIKELSYTDSAAKRGMTYTYTVRAGKKGLSPKYPVIEGAYSLDITVPEAPPPYQSVTDTATGESISCLYEENTLTVSGDVSSETPVCVALYDENGRLVSVKVMNAPGTADAGSGYAAKVIWLNAAGFTSKGECMEFELN